MKFLPRKKLGMIDIGTAAGAVEAVELLDVAIQQISAEQAKLAFKIGFTANR